MSEEKKPRLFYWEDAVEAYIPVTDNEVQGVIDLDHFDKDGEEREVIFKRFDMTDAEFDKWFDMTNLLMC